MTSKIKSFDKNEHIEKFNRVEDIQIGQYYRFVADLKDNKEDKYFTVGNIYIVSKLAYNEITNELHSVTLYIPAHEYRYSDGCEIRLMFQPFCLDFEFVPEDVANKERKELLGMFEDEANLIKDDMNKALKSPEEIFSMIGKSTDETVVKSRDKINISLRLPSPDTMTNTASTIISNSNGKNIQTVKGQLENQMALAETTKVFVNSKNNELSTVLKNTTSVMMEKSKAMLGKANEMMEQVNKVQSKVDTISLYLGKDVEVMTIQDKPESTSLNPIRLFSQKLYMDEEMATENIYCNGSFDYTNHDDFFKKLIESKTFLNRILPSERCITCVQSRRNIKHYSDNSIQNGYMNIPNFSVYLIIRDGERISLITSPVDYQDRLFPTQKEMDQRLEGIDADSVELTDAQKRFSKLEDTYSKVTAILQGVLDRQSTGDAIVFGELPAEKFGSSFFDSTLASQNFEFINDEDSLLGGHALSGKSREWYNQHCNTQFQKGEYIIFTHDMITEDSAPTMYSTNSMDYTNQDWESTDLDGSIKQIAFYKKKPCLKVECTKYSYKKSIDMSKNFNVAIQDEAFSLMKVKPSELEYLLFSRSERPYLVNNFKELVNTYNFINDLKNKAKNLYELVQFALPHFSSDEVHIAIMDWLKDNYKKIDIIDSICTSEASKIVAIIKSSIEITGVIINKFESYAKDSKEIPLFIIAKANELFLITNGKQHLNNNGIIAISNQEIESNIEMELPIAFSMYSYKNDSFNFLKTITSEINEFSIKHTFFKKGLQKLVLESGTKLDKKTLVSLEKNLQKRKEYLFLLIDSTEKAFLSQDNESKIGYINYLFAEMKLHFRELTNKSKTVVFPVYNVYTVVKQVEFGYYDKNIEYKLDGLSFNYIAAISKIFNSMDDLSQLKNRIDIKNQFRTILYARENLTESFLNSVSHPVVFNEKHIDKIKIDEFSNAQSFTRGNEDKFQNSQQRDEQLHILGMKNLLSSTII
jgi:hypothetical protein